MRIWSPQDNQQKTVSNGLTRMVMPLLMLFDVTCFPRLCSSFLSLFPSFFNHFVNLCACSQWYNDIMILSHSIYLHIDLTPAPAAFRSGFLLGECGTWSGFIIMKILLREKQINGNMPHFDVHFLSFENQFMSNLYGIENEWKHISYADKWKERRKEEKEQPPRAKKDNKSPQIK